MSTVPDAVKVTIARAFPQFSADAGGQVLTVEEFQERLHHRHERGSAQQRQHQAGGDAKVLFIMSSFCRDELSTDTAENAHCAASGQHHAEAAEKKYGHKHTADHFPFGGLAGVCSCGDTAYGAAAHHVPTEGDGVVALVGGPHISFRELSAREIDRLNALPAADAKDVKAQNPLLPEWTEVYDRNGPTNRRGYWGSMYRAQMTGTEGSACGAMVGFVDALAVRAQDRQQNGNRQNQRNALGVLAAAAGAAAAAAAAGAPVADADAKAKLTLAPSDPEQNELGRVMNQQFADDALAGATYLGPLNDALQPWKPQWKPPEDLTPDQRAAWERARATAEQRRDRAHVMRTVTRAAVDASARQLPLVAARVHEKMEKHAEHRPILLIDCLAVHWNEPADAQHELPYQTPHKTTLYVAVREYVIPPPPPKTDKPKEQPKPSPKPVAETRPVTPDGSSSLWKAAVGGLVAGVTLCAAAYFLFARDTSTASNAATAAGARLKPS